MYVLFLDTVSDCPGNRTIEFEYKRLMKEARKKQQEDNNTNAVLMVAGLVILLLSRDMKNTARPLCSLPDHSFSTNRNMPIPLNRVVLDTLAKVDFLACLSLTNTSNTLSG